MHTSTAGHAAAGRRFDRAPRCWVRLAAFVSYAVLGGWSPAASAAETAAPERVDEVVFLPSPSRTIGAFLVSGPFDAPQPEIERATVFDEGGRWRLLLVRSDEKGVALDGEGVFYLHTTLRGMARSTSRLLSFVSTGRVTCWLDGRRSAESEAYKKADIRPDDGTRPLAALFRVETERTAAVLIAAASLAVGEGRMVNDRAAVRLRDAGRERTAGLVGSALSVRISPALAADDDMVVAQLCRTGACPAIAGETSVRITVGGQLVHAGVIESVDELARAPVTVRFQASTVTVSPYVIAAAVAVDGEAFTQVEARGHSIAGVRAAADLLDARAAEVTAVPSASAFARLQAEKARLTLAQGGGYVDAEGLGRSLAEAERALETAAAGRDFQKGRTGALERAYISAIDNSPQPYLVYVPSGCVEESAPWPMVVYLHGYVPSYDKHAWLRADPGFNAVMEAEGCILAVPFGRSNTDFVNVGEDDVLRVIDEMKRAYPVDESRIYVYGYSMGGSGVWTLVTHYPSLFAAAIVLAGRTDYYLWHSLEREKVPAWKRQLIDADNPIDQASNIVHLPIRVYHGDADYVIDTAHSQRMVEKLKGLGGRAELHWVKNGSHWSLFDAVMWNREPVAWAKQFRRASAPPAAFALKAYHPRYAGAWGVQAYSMRSPLAPIEVRYERSAEGTVVRAGNTECVAVGRELFFGRSPVLEGGFRVEAIDGTPFSWSGQRGEESTTYYTDAWRGLGAWKTDRLCGPIKEAFRTPFVLVYGSSGGPQATAASRAAAERFAAEWRAFAKGTPAVIADVDLTEDLARAKNLVLFGRRDTNAYIARIAGRLPITWDATTAEIGARTCDLTSRGLAFVFPNPEQAARLVVVMSGLFWGDALPVNHKWDLLPDFIVFEKSVDPLDRMEPVNRAVVAGFFDANWRVTDELTFPPAGAAAEPAGQRAGEPRAAAAD